MKCSHEIFKFKILLLASALLVLVGKQATGLECYCQKGDQIHTTGCTSDRTCEGDICFVKRKRSFGAILEHWGCINISYNPSWNSTCHLTEENLAFNCCMDGDDCNRNLAVYLLHELPPPTVTSTTVQPSATTSSSQVSSSSTNDVPSHPPTSSVDPHTTPPPTTATTVSRPPSSGPAMSCYCNETAATPPSSCINQGYSCDAHSKCYTRRYFDEGRGEIHMKWACLSPQMPGDVCSGSMNNEKNVYECCDGSDLCNRYLKLVLPMEESTTATPASGAPGSSTGGIDLYIIMSIVIVCVLIVLGVVVIAVLIYMFLRHQRLQAEEAIAMSLQKRTSKRPLQLNGVIVNELGHSYSSVPGKSKSLSGLIS